MFSRNLPSQSRVSKSTRGFSRRILTISVFPFIKATVMGVSPLLFLKLTSTLSSRDSNRSPPSGWLEFHSIVHHTFSYKYGFRVYSAIGTKISCIENCFDTFRTHLSYCLSSNIVRFVPGKCDSQRRNPRTVL